MKAIMISIKPKYVAKILNGEKTIEVRKKFPKDYRGWVYIYCTKDKERLVDLRDDNFYFGGSERLNGKVVARFYCNNVDNYVNGRKWSWNFGAPMWGACNDYEYILKDTCLTDDELRNYADDLAFIAIHISNLEIFNEPKELSEFRLCCSSQNHFDEYSFKCMRCKAYRVDISQDEIWCSKRKLELTKAPQNFCYVEVE